MGYNNIVSFTEQYTYFKILAYYIGVATPL